MDSKRGDITDASDTENTNTTNTSVNTPKPMKYSQTSQTMSSAQNELKTREVAPPQSETLQVFTEDNDDEEDDFEEFGRIESPRSFFKQFKRQSDLLNQNAKLILKNRDKLNENLNRLTSDADNEINENENENENENKTDNQNNNKNNNNINKSPIEEIVDPIEYIDPNLLGSPLSAPISGAKFNINTKQKQKANEKNRRRNGSRNRSRHSKTRSNLTNAIEISRDALISPSSIVSPLTPRSGEETRMNYNYNHLTDVAIDAGSMSDTGAVEMMQNSNFRSRRHNSEIFGRRKNSRGGSNDKQRRSGLKRRSFNPNIRHRHSLHRGQRRADRHKRRDSRLDVLSIERNALNMLLTGGNSGRNSVISNASINTNDSKDAGIGRSSMLVAAPAAQNETHVIHEEMISGTMTRSQSATVEVSSRKGMESSSMDSVVVAVPGMVGKGRNNEILSSIHENSGSENHSSEEETQHQMANTVNSNNVINKIIEEEDENVNIRNSVVINKNDDDEMKTKQKSNGLDTPVSEGNASPHSNQSDSTPLILSPTVIINNTTDDNNASNSNIKPSTKDSNSTAVIAGTDSVANNATQTNNNTNQTDTTSSTNDNKNAPNNKEDVSNATKSSSITVGAEAVGNYISKKAKEVFTEKSSKKGTTKAKKKKKKYLEGIKRHVILGRNEEGEMLINVISEKQVESDMLEDAREIYKRFVKPSSENEININSKSRTDLHRCFEPSLFRVSQKLSKKLSQINLKNALLKLNLSSEENSTDIEANDLLEEKDNEAATDKNANANKLDENVKKLKNPGISTHDLGQKQASKDDKRFERLDTSKDTRKFQALSLVQKFRVFDNAADQIESILRTDAFSRFKRTEDYKKFVTDESNRERLMLLKEERLKYQPKKEKKKRAVAVQMQRIQSAGNVLGSVSKATVGSRSVPLASMQGQENKFESKTSVMSLDKISEHDSKAETTKKEFKKQITIESKSVDDERVP